MKLLIQFLVIICLFYLTNAHGSHGNKDNSDRGSAGYKHEEINQQVKTNMNQDHVFEHLEGVINKPKEQMTQEEQNFYYFKLHDYDNNNKLDGLELVSAFAHNEGRK
jgi:hypothetical protein